MPIVNEGAMKNEAVKNAVHYLDGKVKLVINENQRTNLTKYPKHICRHANWKAEPKTLLI